LPEGALTLGPAVAFEHAGFSFRPIHGYYEAYLTEMGVIFSEDQEIVVGIGGGLVPEGMEVIDMAGEILMKVASGVQDLALGEAYTTTIGGIDGLAVDSKGRLDGEPIETRAAHITLGERRFFVAFGYAPTEIWAGEGTVAFELMINSVTFFEPTPMENGCPVTADPDYGYQKERSIRVGNGDMFSGPSLERAYLDQLRGPDGEVIEYERLGSTDDGYTIIDIYELTYNGTTVVLYLDMYHGEPFRVPMGFTCEWEQWGGELGK
jgi:hypothetical protein